MAEEKKADAAAPEVVKNCAGCKKPVKRARRYYRDGKYYCNFNCWRKNKGSSAEAAQPAEAKG